MQSTPSNGTLHWGDRTPAKADGDSIFTVPVTINSPVITPTVITALRNEIARRSTPTHVFALDEITEYGAGATHTAWVHSILR